jgi:hypothetical protein
MIGGLLLAPAAALAQFEGVVEIKGASRADGDRIVPSSGRLWVSARGARMELRTDLQGLAATARRGPGAPMPGGFTMVTLWRVAEPDVTYVLNEERKRYAILSVTDADAAASGQPETWRVERLGRDTVAGFACEKVLLRSSQGEEIDACVAKDILGSRAWMAAVPRQRGSEGFHKALRDAGVDGFMTRMAWRAKGEPEPRATFELVRAERKAVPASVLEVPAGYQKVDAMMLHASPEHETTIRDAEEQMQESLKNLPPERRKQVEEMLRKMRGGS